jgi:hypothetical protein
VPTVKIETIGAAAKDVHRHILQQFGRDRCMSDRPSADDRCGLGRHVGERQHGAADRKDSKARFHGDVLS